MNNGDLLGFVGIDWNHVQTENSKTTDALIAVAKEISQVYENR